MKKIILFALLTYIGLLQVRGQEKPMTASDSSLFIKSAPAISQVVEQRTTANAKDILTNLLNVSIKNFLGDDQAYSLDLSFYAIRSIFKKDSVTLDYDRQRKLKNNSFNLGLIGGENSAIKKFSAGFSIALLDQRDIKSKTYSNREFDNLKQIEQSILNIKRGLEDYYAKNYPKFYEPAGVKKKQILDSSWNAAIKKQDFSGLDPIIKEALASNEVKDKLNLFGPSSLNDGVLRDLQSGINPLIVEYNEVGKRFAQKPLWTLAPTASYDRENRQGEYVLGSNFTVGIFGEKAEKPWQLELKSQLKIASDSTLTYSNYNDKPLSISLGVNKVLLQDNDKTSKMEFKFFTQYNRQLGHITAGQEADVFTLNTTLRVKLYKSIWLPVTLKYDTDKGNVLGLFTLTANLDN